MRKAVWGAAALVLWVTAASAAPVRSAGKVELVTLYRGQALVTRAVPFEAPAGPVELLVGELPSQILPDSLYADGGKEIEIRRSKAVSVCF